MFCYSMQHIPQEERPRERLVQYGPEYLSITELIAIVLGSGTKTKPVLTLAQEIVARFGDIHQLSNATISELCQVKGVGPAKAIQLKAAFSLGLRASRQTIGSRYRIENPQQAYQLIRDDLENQVREIFMVILQDTKGYVITQEIISIGDLSNVLVHPREVFYPAIRHKAAGMILAHNHPSGDPTPSPQDREITTKLIQVGQLVGIPVQDHLIVGKGRYLSLREEKVNSF